MRRRELLYLVLTLVWAAACGRGPVRFTDPGRPIATHVGQAFAIALDANATTGYTWHLAAPLPPAVALVAARYFPDPLAVHRAGAGGREVWTFQAVQAGQGQIQLQYARAGGPIGRTATFTVDVR